MESKPTLVHLQITRNCNLRCSFCGQWGKSGFFADAKGEEMTLNDWKKVIDELATINPLPRVYVWGGEALISPIFEDVVKLLKEKGFRLSLVTNGVFIDKHYQTLNRDFDKICISIDGERELHDSIRGKGVYDKVTKNLPLLDKEKVIITTVATENLNVESFANTFKDYKILLQELIPFDGQEIYTVTCPIPKNMTYLQHGDKAKMKTCLAPHYHMHITWNGEVTYCTDFYEFSAGNVKKDSLMNIWSNDKSNEFRRKVANGENPNCKYCSWKNSEEF